MKIRVGRVEIAFAAVILVYLVLSFATSTNTFAGLLQGIVAFLGLWVSVRFSRYAVRHLLWRLRNRLIVAYFFIAVVPIVLITFLVGLGAALAGGQLTIYLLTSELERRTTGLRGSAEFLIDHPDRRQEWFNNIGPFLRTRYPGLELCIEDGQRWTFPPGATLIPPPPSHKTESGLVLKDGLLYGWAYVTKGTRIVTAMFPITREYLGVLAPDIGESAILDFRQARGVMHTTAPESNEPSHNRLPPALNRLDFEIRWGAPIPVANWDDANKTESEWVTVRTRPSAVLRSVFTQKLDGANDLVYILFVSVAVLFLTAEIIALLVGVSITKTITGAVHQLYEGTLRVTKGDFTHRIPFHASDQLGELASSFNHMTENMQRLLVAEKERERLQAELEIAREVQRELFPKHLPHMECIRVTASCNPARLVSGDYYDYQQLHQNRLAIAIGDVAGKGISAALLMATLQSSFRAQLRGSLTMAASPGEIHAQIAVSTSNMVTQLNQQLHADTSPEKYATFYLGVFDEPTSTLTYTNAGHLPPILVRDSEATRLDVNGMVVGAFAFARYNESKIRLREGDLLVFFTDGITEPENEYGEMFSEDRLADLVLKNAHLDDSEIVTCILGAVRQWTGTDELQDDMTLLLVRRC